MERVVPAELDTVMSQNNKRGKRQRLREICRETILESDRGKGRTPLERQADREQADMETWLTMRETKTARGWREAERQQGG